MDAFSEIFGACRGLLIGSAAAALLIRRGSSLLAGVVVGFVAYWLAVAPYLASSDSSDVSTSENVGFVLFVFIPAALFAVAGAAIGTVISVCGGRIQAEPRLRLISERATVFGRNGRGPGGAAVRTTFRRTSSRRMIFA